MIKASLELCLLWCAPLDGQRERAESKLETRSGLLCSAGTCLSWSRGDPAGGGDTPGHRWVQLQELPAGLALSCWGTIEGVLPPAVSLLRSLQMLPSVLCWLTWKKRPFPGWGDASPYSLPHLWTFGGVFLQQQWHPVASWIFLGKEQAADSLNNVEFFIDKRILTKEARLRFPWRVSLLKKVWWDGFCFSISVG